MKNIILLACLFYVQSAFSGDFKPHEELNDVASLKSEILKISEHFKGQGDPDRKIQNTLEPYVKKLVTLAPQKPAGERIKLITGRWQQVWGPYDNTDSGRGVDPTFDPENIFQVVFPDGYYWNVGRNLDKKTGKVKRIGLLRGEYKVADGDNLKIKFTKLKRLKIKNIPHGFSLTDLAEPAEKKELKGLRSALPSLFVRLFFPKGNLREVYTDEDIRLTYGTDNKGYLDNYLYVLKRVP